jgi:hypothetical protein
MENLNYHRYKEVLNSFLKEVLLGKGYIFIYELHISSINLEGGHESIIVITVTRLLAGHPRSDI